MMKVPRHGSGGCPPSSGPAGYPIKPLVSYPSYRQLSGWNLPPLVIRAIGAHCENQDVDPRRAL